MGGTTWLSVLPNSVDLMLTTSGYHLVPMLEPPTDMQCPAGDIACCMNALWVLAVDATESYAPLKFDRLDRI